MSANLISYQSRKFKARLALGEDEIGNCQPKCLFCPVGFDNKIKTQRHMFLQHGSNLVNLEVQFKSTLPADAKYNNSKDKIIPVNYKPDREDNGKYLCPLCVVKELKTKSSLIAHIKDHFNKPYKCKICQVSCKTKGALAIHNRNHTKGKKPYDCEQCKRKFSNLAHLKRHVESIHDKTRPFSCEHCSFLTYRRDNILAHIKSMHLHMKDYHCTICMYSARNLGAVLLHQRTIHEHDYPYKCLQCSYETAYKKSLVTHVNRVHKPRPTSPAIELSFGESLNSSYDSSDGSFTTDSEIIDAYSSDALESGMSDTHFSETSADTSNLQEMSSSSESSFFSDVEPLPSTSSESLCSSDVEIDETAYKTTTPLADRTSKINVPSSDNCSKNSFAFNEDSTIIKPRISLFTSTPKKINVPNNI